MSDATSRKRDPRFAPLIESIQNVPDKIVERLREQIASGTLLPGEQLPSERDLATSLNVSRTALREATRILQSAGVLVAMHGSGTFVTRENAVEKIAGAVAAVAVVDRRDIRDLCEVRRMLEPQAAALAAERIDPPAVDRLRQICGEMRSHSTPAMIDVERLQRLDGDFHDTIFRATGNGVLTAMIGGVMALLRESRRYSVRRPNRAPKTCREHQRITDAIADGDPVAARAAMTAHLVSVEKSLFPAQRT
ncbi:MAG: FadR/GntR family transcriptional regulator [Candidatus Velthaea sp.]